MIKAPGRTEEDLADSRYKLQSALNSCCTAIENGYLIGGGVSLCRAQTLIEKLVPKDDSERAGIFAISTALTAPLQRILENSQCPKPEAVVKQIIEGPDGNIGFNVETRRVEDLAAAGVLDSAKALGSAVRSALAYATGILKTGAWDTTPSSET